MHIRGCLRAVVVCLVWPLMPAQAQERDEWFARDKLLHFGACGVVAGGGYGLGTLTLETRAEAWLLGTGLGLGAGVAKELVDAAGFGTASWKDLAWDAAGTVVGAGFAWSIDLLVGGVSARRPLLGPPSSRATALQARFSF